MDNQSIASSSNVHLEPTQSNDIKSISELPSCQSEDYEENQRKNKKRKYDNNYLEMEFHFTEEKSDPQPFGVIGNEVLAISTCKLSLLCRHSESRNVTDNYKLAEYFRRKLAINKKRCVFCRHSSRQFK